MSHLQDRLILVVVWFALISAVVSGIIAAMKWVWNTVVSFWDWLGAWHWIVFPGIALVILAGFAGFVILWVQAGREQAAKDEAARQAAARSLAAAAKRQALLDKHYSITQDMSGTDFEHWVARLMRRTGMGDAQVVGGANDRGADVISHLSDGSRVVVQCKRYSKQKVGSADMQKFVGMVYHQHHADLALYVTTSSFTREAASIAASRRVLCVDGSALARWSADDTPPPLVSASVC